MDKKILITGGNGMLAFAVKKVFTEANKTVVPMTKDELDITSNKSIQESLDKYNPEVLINCAAYTNVNEAEENPELANKVNGDAVGAIAYECKRRNIKFIHISTDYVFGENNKDGYTESELPKSPLNKYGSSKLHGEQEALRRNPDSYIVRTSWIYGPNGKNFVDTMLDLGSRLNELTIVEDEIGTPTFTFDVAHSLLKLVDGEYTPGIYHVVNGGHCSRFEEAAAVFALVDNPISLKKIKLKDYPRKAQVPNVSILINTKLPPLRNWKLALKEYIGSKAKNE